MLFQWARTLNTTVRTIQRNMKSAVLILLVVLLWRNLGIGLNFLLALLLLLFIYLLSGGWKFVRIVIKTLPRDVRALMVVTKLKRHIRAMMKDHKGIPTLFYEVCDRYPNKTCFIDAVEGKRWSFKEFDNYSNQIANYFLALGYQPGDSVAVFMESSTQYVAVWLGLAKIGVIPALINNNLRLESLVHCLEAASAKSIIYSADMQGAIQESEHLFPKLLKLHKLGTPNSPSESTLDSDISSASVSRPPYLKYDFNSPLMYIYTSGTTGLPKAAKVAHSRYYYMANSVHMFSGFDHSTIVYDTLPLYHTAGGILGVGQSLLQGRSDQLCYQSRIFV